MGFHENLIQSFQNFKTRYLGDIGSGTVRDWITSIMQTKADKSESIKNITRSGTTFTATRANGTTFTFTQQDNNTTTGTTYNAGGVPDNTTFGTNGSIKRGFDYLNGRVSGIHQPNIRNWETWFDHTITLEVGTTCDAYLIVIAKSGNSAGSAFIATKYSTQTGLSVTRLFGSASVTNVSNHAFQITPPNNDFHMVTIIGFGYGDYT